MNKSLNDNGRLVFGIQIIVLMFVFILICAVLTGVFSSAVSKSNEASALNDGAEICRSALEVLRASDSTEDGLSLLGAENISEKTTLSYGKNLSVSKDEAEYLLKIETLGEKNNLESLRLSVYSSNGTEIYTLDAEVFRKVG